MTCLRRVGCWPYGRPSSATSPTTPRRTSTSSSRQVRHLFMPARCSHFEPAGTRHIDSPPASCASAHGGKPSAATIDELVNRSVLARRCECLCHLCHSEGLNSHDDVEVSKNFNLDMSLANAPPLPHRRGAVGPAVGPGGGAAARVRPEPDPISGDGRRDCVLTSSFWTSYFRFSLYAFSFPTLSEPKLHFANNLNF